MKYLCTKLKVLQWAILKQDISEVKFWIRFPLRCQIKIGNRFAGYYLSFTIYHQPWDCGLDIPYEIGLAYCKQVEKIDLNELDGIPF